MPWVVDTHAHLDGLEELDLALCQARKAGVVGIIAMGSNHQSNLRVLEICRSHPHFIHPALGLHPWDLGQMDSQQVNSTLKCIRDNISNIVAIGEVGLDYDKRVIKTVSKEHQKRVLAQLLELAREYGKPVSVHSRYSWRDCLDLLQAHGVEKAVFHWYTGLSSVLRDIIEAGYYISATPAAEYHEEHRRAIRETPAERLLLETDCPVQYGRENRYRSAPSDIRKSLKAAASLKGINEAALAEMTTCNAGRLFGLDFASCAIP